MDNDILNKTIYNYEDNSSLLLNTPDLTLTQTLLAVKLRALHTSVNIEEIDLQTPLPLITSTPLDIHFLTKFFTISSA